MNRQRPSKQEVRTLVGEGLGELYERSPASVDCLAGLDRLHGQLVDAAQAYETGPKQQRQAICDSIIATTDFLKGQGFTNETLVPLNRVLWAIVNLTTQNNPDPLFCEKPQKTKPQRSMENAVQQGHLAALADAWLVCSARDEGDDAAKLERAARHLSGANFGTVDGAKLQSARSYQRQDGHHELVYRSYEQMTDVLTAEAAAAGGGEAGLRMAVQVQIDALNSRAELRQG